MMTILRLPEAREPVACSSTSRRPSLLGCTSHLGSRDSHREWKVAIALQHAQASPSLVSTSARFGPKGPCLSTCQLLPFRPRCAAYDEPLLRAVRFYPCGLAKRRLAEVLRSRPQGGRAEMLSMQFAVDFAGYSSWESRDGLQFLQ